MNYGMYTTQGNELVANIVERAQSNRWTWSMTYTALVQLSRNYPEVAAEALDTEVRECVYNAIGAYKRDEEFYV